MANATSTQLQELYVAYFGRAADPTGLDYWTEKGITQAAFAADMYAQNEFKSAYGDKTVESQVNQIYKNLFDREADVTGLTYWTQQINLGTLKVAEIATHLIWAAQNNTGSETDKTALSNRTDAAIAYTAEVKSTTAGILAYQAQSTDPWVSGGNIAEGISYLAGIDATTVHTAAGVTASVATIKTAGDPTGVGSTFVLTTNTDSAGTTSAANGTITSDFRFTDSGNEVVTADIGTIQLADVLLDGSSTDSDVMNITANGTLAAFTANRIEKFVVDMAAGSPSLDVSNLTNFNNIDVKGTVAGSVLDIDAQSKQPVIKLDGYTRVLLADVDTLAGTTSAGTAETMNFEVSGATYGSAASSRSGITLTSAIAGTLETLNITSIGTAANVFTLDSSTSVTLDNVNFLGATDLETRVDATDVSGLTLTAGSATGTQTLKLDRTGDLATATNANLFSGFENIVVIDSASPAVGGDGAVLSGLTSGQKVTLADDFNASTLTFQAVTGSSDTATVVLDNETASTDIDVASLDIQNVETVTIDSSGKAGTSLTTASDVNLIDSFTGDATTITVIGDTALDLDLNIDNASTGAAGSRAVTVDFSGGTGAYDIATAASTGTGSVAYTITGNNSNNTLNANAASNATTITGGSGNDTITGGSGNDTIDLGAGVNTYNASAGSDSITLGAGVDTLVFGEADVTAVAQVSTLAITSQDAGLLQVNIDGNVYQTAYDINAASTTSNFLADNGADVLADTGMTVTDTGTTGIVLTGVAGTTYDVSMNYGLTGVQTVGSVTATSAAVVGVTVQSTISGFSTGTVDDVFSFDVSAINDVTNVDVLNDSEGASLADDDIVVHTHTGGTTQTTDDVADGANVIKFAYSNSINAFSDISTLLNANNLTIDIALSLSDKVASVYYDADAGAAVFGLLGNEASATFDASATFNEIATASMTITAYNALSASNFSIV